MLTLPEVLTHEAVAALIAQLQPQIKAAAKNIQVDAGALRTFDSSALALLLEYRRLALAEGKSFAVQGLPAQLQQLATLYGVAELLTGAQA